MQTIGVDCEKSEYSGLYSYCRSRLLIGIYRIITGLVLVIVFLVILAFLIYPLLPDLIVIKSQLKQISPYNIGYNVTVQLLVKVLRPVDEIKDPSILQNKSLTIEKVNEGVEVSNLEDKETVLEIGSVNIKGKVVDDLSPDAMLRGFWHYPSSVVPGKLGNTVIFGHRFNKLPPSTETFFNLDRVSVGDKIQIVQQDKELSYTVISVTTIEKDNSSILEHKGDYRLTLITCTPMWSSEKRLAVVAIQDNISSAI